MTTGLPRANGQVERLNSVIISVLSKLSLDDPIKWYRHVDRVQQVINSTFSRSINSSPFEVLFGIQMRSLDDIQIKKLLDEEYLALYNNQRENLREDAKKSILKIQDENRRS